MSATFICKIIESHRFNFNTEAELQNSIGFILGERGFAYTRECIVNADRLDFLIHPNIALEVKIADPRSKVIRQLHRYAQIEKVGSIILVTTKANHLNMPESINGKPLHVASLLGGAF